MHAAALSTSLGESPICIGDALEDRVLNAPLLDVVITQSAAFLQLHLGENCSGEMSNARFGQKLGNKGYLLTLLILDVHQSQRKTRPRPTGECF